MKWLDQLFAHLREGKNAFILTGDIGDSFPHLTECEDDLLPWHKVVGAALHAAQPQALGWTFDPALGFSFRRNDEKIVEGEGDGEGKTLFQNLLGKKKKPAANPDDTIAKLREQMRDDDEDVLPIKFTDATPIMMRAYESGAKTDPPQSCFGLIHDADASWQMQGTNNGDVVRAFLLLRRFAESERYRRAGHVLIMAVPSMAVLPEFFRRPDSPFVRIDIGRPDLEARQAFLEDVVVTEALQRTLERQQAERRQRDGEHRARLQEFIDSLSKERAAHRELEGSIDETEAVVQARNELQTAVERVAELQCGIGQMRQRLQSEIAALATIPAPTVELSGDAWKRLRVGDEVIFTDTNRPGGVSYRKRVLEVTKEGVSLSLSSDMTRPTKDPKNDSTVFYGFESGKLVQRLKGDNGVPFLPNGVSVKLVPESTAQHQDLMKQKRQELAELENDTLAHQNADAAVKIAEANLEAARKNARANWERRNEELAALLSQQTASLRASNEPVKADEPPKEARLVQLIEAPFSRPSCGLPVAARLMQGMGYRDIIGLLRTSQANALGCDEEGIRKARSHILMRSFGHLLDVVEPEYGFEGLAGMDGVISFLQGVKANILLGLLGMVPLGVLLMGPPGTGKTAVAEAFARECGFLFVKLRNVRSMWNGETERQMEETFAAIRMLAPVVVFRDEVDQEDSGRDSYNGDNGVSARIRKGWMEFLADPTIRGQVFVINCSNRPDLLDAALKRSGRTDERIPILMPDKHTRTRLFPVMLRRLKAKLRGRLAWKAEEGDFEKLADLIRGRTGADVEVVVRHAAEYAPSEDGVPTVGVEHLERAVHDLMPPDGMQHIAGMTRAALLACSRREYLPSNLEEILEVSGLSQRPQESQPKPSSHTDNDEALRHFLDLHRDQLPKA